MCLNYVGSTDKLHDDNDDSDESRVVSIPETKVEPSNVQRSVHSEKNHKGYR